MPDHPKYGMVALAIAVWAFACATVAGAESSSPGAPTLSWFERLFASPTWMEAVASTDSPQKAARLVRLHVRFQEDTSDDWSDGRATWDRGFGDCEDLAAAVVDLCRAAGIEINARIWVFRATGSEGHAVAVGEWRGRMWISSNGWFQYVEPMAEAAESVAEEMNWNDRRVAYVTLDEMKGSRASVGAKAVPALND